VLFQRRTGSTIKRATGHRAHTGLCALDVRRYTTDAWPLRRKSNGSSAYEVNLG
jgi:hypothetical protein